MARRKQEATIAAMVWFLTVAGAAAAAEGTANGGDLSAAWRILRGAGPEVSDTRATAWTDLAVDRGREHRLAHPREPGLPLWLERHFELPDDLGDGPWVVAIDNHLVLERALINGHPAPNVATIQFAVDECPELAAIAAADPGFASPGQIRRWSLEHHRYDAPALLLFDRAALRPGGNRLLLQAWDFSREGELLGRVELRRPRLEDAVVPFSWRRSEGEHGTVSVIGLRPRIPLAQCVTAAIAIEDRLGTVLRREERVLELTGTADVTLELRQEDPRAYKAVVAFTSADGVAPGALAPHWAYLRPRLDREEQRFSLEGAQWRMRYLADDERVPTDADGPAWRPMYVPATLRSQAEYYLYDRHRLALRRTFRIPAELQRPRLLLEIEGLRQIGEVWLNGTHLGTVTRNDAEAALDIGAVARRDGDNELLIVVGDGEALGAALGAARPPGEFAKLHVDLLLGEVAVRAVPAVRTVRTWVTTALAEGNLGVRTWVENSGDHPVTAAVAASVRHRERTLFALPEQQVVIPAGGTAEVVAQRPWADPELWSPWSPTLHGLETVVSVDGTPVDRRLDRFGARELTIDGDQIRLNGEVVHGIGHETFAFGAWGMPDGDLDAKLRRAIRALGYTWIRDHRLGRHQHEVNDEIGLMSSTFLGPWDNTRGLVTADPRTEAFYAAEGQAYIPAHANHPSIAMWAYSNEVVYRFSAQKDDDELAASVARVANRFAELDPSRLVIAQGSQDLNGRLATWAGHYSPFRDLPRTGKPLIEDEFSWMFSGLSPGSHHWLYGEAAMKPTTYRGQSGWSPMMISSLFPFVAMRPREVLALRHHRAAAFAAFHPPLVTNRNVEPILAELIEAREGSAAATRFWADQPIERTIAVFNDSGTAAAIVVRVGLDPAPGDQPAIVLERTVELPQGGSTTVPLRIPVLGGEALREVRAVVTATVDGSERSRRVHRWTLTPRSWVAAARGVRVTLLDPAGAASGVFETVGAEIERIAGPDDFGGLRCDLLAIGPDLDPAVFAGRTDALATYIRDGGKVLLLPQRTTADWHPVALTPRPTATNYIPFLIAAGSPLVDGLLSEDFAEWAPDGSVHRMAYRPVPQGTMRTIVGSPPATVALVDGVIGAGRLIVCALDLRRERLAVEPAAARVLANILAELRDHAPAPRARTVVISGGRGDRAAALRDRVLLHADYPTGEPASLDGYQLAVLVDHDAPGSEGLRLAFELDGADAAGDAVLYLRELRLEADAAGAAAPVLTLDPARLAPFVVHAHGNDRVCFQGDYPVGWGARSGGIARRGRVALEADPLDRAPAIALRSLDGETLSFQTFRHAGVRPGRYRLTFAYLLTGGASAAVIHGGEGVPEMRTSLPHGGGAWRRFDATLEVPAQATPSRAFADRLRHFVEGGGTVLAQNVSAGLGVWLEDALGIRIERRPINAVLATKQVWHPLLAGIGDNDLAWFNVLAHKPLDGLENAGQRILAAEMVPEGALALTDPAVVRWSASAAAGWSSTSRGGSRSAARAARTSATMRAPSPSACSRRCS